MSGSVVGLFGFDTRAALGASAIADGVLDEGCCLRGAISIVLVGCKEGVRSRKIARSRVLVWRKKDERAKKIERRRKEYVAK